ncbi:hypothetical protein [Methylomonas koyamae]|uniref:Uncharacterized protein n=1 Tax=Methylomonas koyamae TaxID=702114 RepID=A0AA91I480_9GAMM|nr:hypothetical protein [Methylomonas koyamae]OAI23802.1 hypothetical protein A1356_17155 [Methylomonas koyamae]
MSLSYGIAAGPCGFIAMPMATGFTPDDGMAFGFGESGRKQARRALTALRNNGRSSRRKNPFPIAEN